MKTIHKLALLGFAVIIFILPIGEHAIYAQEGTVQNLPEQQGEDFYTDLDGE